MQREKARFAPGVSIVTGGASGIGKALVSELVARGGHVVVADLDKAGAAALAESLTRTGPGSARAVHLDVTDAVALQALVAQVAEERGRLDLLCNNAGVLFAGPFAEMDSRHWRQALDVNVTPVVEGTHAAYRVMAAQSGGGHILNTGSLAGLMPAPRMAPYTLSKWAVVGFSQAVRAEALRDGVHVSVVCPAFVETPLLDDIKIPTSGYAAGSFRRNTRLLQPKLLTAEQVARAALDGLAHDRAVIPVGWLAQFLWRAQRFAPALVAAGVRWQAGR